MNRKTLLLIASISLTLAAIDQFTTATNPLSNYRCSLQPGTHLLLTPDPHPQPKKLELETTSVAYTLASTAPPIKINISYCTPKQGTAGAVAVSSQHGSLSKEQAHALQQKLSDIAAFPHILHSPSPFH